MHSKAIALLSAVQMCKFFSHYGVRALLILYMVHFLKLPDGQAFGINALFCGLVELSSIFGGLLADRYLGLSRSVLLGSCILSAGYIALIIPGGFFYSMSLIIVGASLFSSNLTALLGLAFVGNNCERTAGFTLFYMLQNLGALAATLLCGAVATYYGFQAGFILASLGMLIGSLLLVIGRKHLKDLDSNAKKQTSQMMGYIYLLLILAVSALILHFQSISTLLLPWMSALVLLYFVTQLLKEKVIPKQKIYKLALYLCGIILFFAVEDQICSSLMLFADRETYRTFLGWTIPSSFITLMNPLVIIGLGSLISKKHFPMIVPFLLSAGSFGALSLCCLLGIDCTIFGMMGIVALISMSEIMIGPRVLSYTSEIASKGHAGMMMGLIPIAFSLAFQLSGALSQMVAIQNKALSLHTYGVGFAVIALILVIFGILIEQLIKRYTHAKHNLS